MIVRPNALDHVQYRHQMFEKRLVLLHGSIPLSNDGRTQTRIILKYIQYYMVFMEMCCWFKVGLFTYSEIYKMHKQLTMHCSTHLQTSPQSLAQQWKEKEHGLQWQWLGLTGSSPYLEVHGEVHPKRYNGRDMWVRYGQQHSEACYS